MQTCHVARRRKEAQELELASTVLGRRYGKIPAEVRSILNISEDIQPLTAFRNNSVKMMRHLKETQRPIVLTVNGKAEAVVLDKAAYQRLQDLAALASEEEGIRQGEEDVRMGRTRDAREVLEELRTYLGIPR